jgi:hypothetical protein
MVCGMSNASQAKAYRERLKADPERVAMLRSKSAERMRKMRAAQKSGAQHGAQQPCEPTVSTPRKISPEERAALLAAFDEPVALQSTAHLGGKHAAPSTVYHGIPPEALIKQYQEHHAKQLPQQVPLNDHPFIKALQERIPCTLVKELPQKEKPQ